MNHPHILSERLRQEMQRQGLSAMELARRAGVKNSFIYDILNGKSRHPSTVTLAPVAETLGVSLAYLAGANGAPAGEGRKTPAGSPASLTVWAASRLSVSEGRLRALRIAGDAMAPTLLDGDDVLVDTSRRTPSPPGLFMLSDGASHAAKRLEQLSGGQTRVISDNSRYAPRECPAKELEILGRIVWFGRKI